MKTSIKNAKIVYAVMLLASYLSQLLYSINVYLGAFSVMMSVVLLFICSPTLQVFSIYGLIYSLPISYISILGDQFHHILSWYNIFLVIFSVELLIRNYHFARIRKKSVCFIGLGILFLLLLYNNLGYGRDIIELMQVMMIIVPCILFYLTPQKINGMVQKYANSFSMAICATALFTITQFILFTSCRHQIGFIQVNAVRIICNAWFKGFSVLSVFLGIGILLQFISFLKTKRLGSVVIMLICFFGIVVNTSRTGLVACALMVNIVFFQYLLRKKNGANFILSCLIMIILEGGLMLFFLSHRSMSLLNDNGRLETYANGLQEIFRTGKNLFLGIGLSEHGYGKVSPHNFILQSVLDMGILAGSILFSQILLILIKLQKSIYVSVLWLILIGGMFVTAFFSNTYIVICFILAVLGSRENCCIMVGGKYGSFNQRYRSNIQSGKVS